VVLQVTRWISIHSKLLGPTLTTPMHRFVDPERHPVHCAVATASVRECLTTLVNKHVTGLAVTMSDGGDIIANVSLSDVRKLGTAHSATEFEGLLETNVLEYLRRKSGDSAAPSLSPLVLHKDDSLGTAIELLASSKMCVSPWFSVSLLKSKWLSSRDVGRWCNG
jgi:hypothetical protein